MKKLIKVLVMSLIFAGLHSCKKKENVTTNVNDYEEYVSTYPENLISVTPNLKFYLKENIDASITTEGVISMEPKVKGTVTLYENAVLFIPEEKLEANKEYKITLHLSKLYKDIPKDLKNFTVDLKTRELLYTVSLKSPKVYDKDWNYVEGFMNASDVIDTSKLSSLLTVLYDKKKVAVKFDIHDKKYATKINFKIDSLQRFANDKKLKIVWKGDGIGSTTKGEREITITGKNNFKVLEANVIDGAHKRIEISFSDAIKKDQSIKGLIQFKNHYKNAFTYKIDNNVVKVYPTNFSKDQLEVQVFKGIKNEEGYTLKEDFIKTLHFKQLNPSISFIKSGTILPDSKNLKINFNAVNLRAVDVTIYKIFKNNVLQFLQQNELEDLGNLNYVGLPEAKYTVNLSNKGLELYKKNAFAFDLKDMISVEEGAMYRVQLSFNEEYSNYSCDGKRPEGKISYGKKAVKGNNNRSYRSDYSWSDREDPCKGSFYYYNEGNNISTNILATNLGAIVKKGSNNNMLVAVTDILTTQPVNGAKVTLYNFQQQAIVSARTNAEGIVNFKDVKDEFFAVIAKEKNVTYIKLQDGNTLSMSKFDVSGERLQKGLKGYIYGERGVWRPGDQLFLTFVLNDKANPIPEKHPIKFELKNPQGKIVERKIVYKRSDNMYAFSPQTNRDAITGDWGVSVEVGGAYFYKSLKIETIKPNRLKIKLTTTEKVIKSDTPIEGDVAVKWMHGAIARNLKLDINGRFAATNTTFKNFGNYNFDDITRHFGTEEFSILTGNLDNDGKTKFSVKPNLDSKAPGMLRAAFITKVYENGGGFSLDVFSKKVSPYKAYVGLNSAEEEQSRNYLFTDKDYDFDVASVTEEGKGKVTDLEVFVYKLSWSWWWRSSNYGLSYYDGSNYREPYKKVKVTTKTNGKGTFNLKVDKNDWGRYLVKVVDKKSGHSTAKVVYYDWPYWYGRKKGNQNKSNATMLVFTTDKDEYKVNESAMLRFPSSEGGRALITIENGIEVLDNYWVETKDKETIFNFPITKKYTPNVFVNISYLQKHSQTKNDLPIRMYGSVPISVYDPNTKLAPEIQMADEFRPESIAKLRVQEKNGKSMSYTIAIVDEGLLDLTRFKTPNAWSSFYAKQSLGVKTWDIYNDIIGAYGGGINQILSIGGDEGKAGGKNKKADRFKPMVRFLGPFKLEAGGTGYHEVKIPQYIGAVKAMVVATNAEEDAYGSTSKSAFVRKPVMILASLPRKITPKETVTLPVTVFAMKPNIKKVKVTIQPNASYTIIGDDTQTVTFDQPDEKMAYFKLKVNDFKGIGKVKIDAVSGVEKATYDVEIDVLNPNPITTEVKELILKAGESGAIDFTTFGSKGTNEASIELSTLPPMNFTKRLEYLIRYPHGCVEQTTSSVFPQLYLSDIFDVSKEREKSIERNIKAAIVRLSDFQMSNGGLSYWQGGSYVSDWGSSYAGHFLIEASKKGYVLPIGFKQKWISYQKQTAKNWRHDRSNGYSRNSLKQAYRLYTLSLVNSSDLASMNRLRETKNISSEAKLRLASAYALIGKKSIANTILKTITETNYERKHYSGYGSSIRNKAMALETYSLLKDLKKTIPLANDIAKELSSERWMSTQTTAYSLLSMSQFAIQNGDSKGINATYEANTVQKSATTAKSLYVTDIENLSKENNLKIKNNNEGFLYVRLYNKGVLPVGEEKIVQSNLEATVVYKSKTGTIITPDNLIQGTNFIGEITIKNTTGERKENIALTQYIPSGWEIINTRFTDFGNSTTSAKVDYTDIRDASISNYFTLNKFETKKFKVLLNASYLGEYYLPGVQCEAMYDNEYLVRTKGQWIQVVK